MENKTVMIEVDSLSELCINNRIYQLIDFLQEGECCLPSEEMLDRARNLKANIGQKDGEFLLENEYQIPDSFKGSVIFCFPDWTCPECSEMYFLIYFRKSEGKWIKKVVWKDACCGSKCRLVRLK